MFLNRITVIGSSNTDIVIKTTKLPSPGETILGGKFFMNPGGKAASAKEYENIKKWRSHAWKLHTTNNLN